MSPRPRSKIIENLEGIYREAYDAARTAGDDGRMHELDASFQREQILLEVLLDIRDGIYAITEAPTASKALEKLEALRRLTKFR